MIQAIQEFFSYGFVVNAFFAAIFLSISCGIVGSYIVARRLVFISGGITHASFGGIGIAYFLQMNPLLGATVFSVLSAFGIHFFSRKGNLREDSAIAILWSSGMAIGIIFVFMTPGYVPNLMTYLFGSILTITMFDLLMLLALTVLVIAFFSVFFRFILYVAFDEEFLKIRGVNVSFINYALMFVIALTIVLSIRSVGIILVMSLLTLPQNTANLFTRSFRKIILLSVFFGFTGSMAGLVLSYILNIPSGASIIFFLTIQFFLIKVIRNGKNGKFVKKNLDGGLK